MVEKVAGLATMEVEGVADLGGDFERAVESVRERIGLGNKRGDQGVKAEVKGHEVAISVTIMVEFGHVVLDVARQVQANVARKTQRMLGLRVVEVNVTVDDVRTARADEPHRGGRRRVCGRLTSSPPAGQPLGGPAPGAFSPGRARGAARRSGPGCPIGGAVVLVVGAAVVAVVAGAVGSGSGATVVVDPVPGGCVVAPVAAPGDATARRLRLGVGRAAGRGPGGDRFARPAPDVLRTLGREPVGQRVAPAAEARPSRRRRTQPRPLPTRAGGAPSPRSSTPRSSSASIARPNAPNTITTAVRPVTINTPGCTRSRAAPTDSFTPAKRSRTRPRSRIPVCLARHGVERGPQAGSRPYAFVIVPHGGAARGNRHAAADRAERSRRAQPAATRRTRWGRGPAMPNGRSPTMLMRSITRRWGK